MLSEILAAAAIASAFGDTSKSEKGFGMRSIFAFQMVAFFAAMPFALSWVSSAEFAYAWLALWVGWIIYAVSFVFMIFAVRSGIRDWDW